MKLAIAIQTPEVAAVIPVALISGQFEEKLAKAAGWGADGVELMTTHPAQLDREQIRNALRKNGLQVAAIASGGLAFSLGLSLLNADANIAARAKTSLYELIDFAIDLDAPLVTIGSFRGRAASCGTDGRQRLVSILQRAADYAHRRAIRLAIEPLNRYESDLIANAEQGLAFLEELNHPAVGLLLDTYHVNIEEKSWTEPFHQLMQAGKLWHVHLGDNNRLPPGRGLIDFAAIVSTLRQGGYAGYLSAELLAKPDPDTAARETLEFMIPLVRRSGEG